MAAAGWLVCAAGLLLPGAMGCRPAGPVTVMLAVDYRGASPREVEEALWQPIQQALAQSSDVTKVIGVSTRRRMEVFVVARAGTDERKLLDGVDELMEQNLDRLPAEAAVGMAQPFPGPQVPPEYDVRQEPVLQIDLDREKLAALGVSARRAAEQIKQERATIAETGHLGGIYVVNQEGRQVPLSQCARVEVDYEPSHRVQTWSRTAGASAGP